MDLHEIYIDAAKRRLFGDCVDKLWMGGKPYNLKKMEDRTVEKTDELYKYKD